MSAAAGQHHLVAVGNDSPQARLCDIRSGAFAHTLTGHSEAVWACAWSPRSEYLLATGSADHTVRRGFDMQRRVARGLADIFRVEKILGLRVMLPRGGT